MAFFRRMVVAFALLCVFAGTAAADDLEKLARDFWAWRVVHQPLSGDDIPRLARPADWVPDWSAETLAWRSYSAFFEDERPSPLVTPVRNAVERPAWTPPPGTPFRPVSTSS